MTQAASRPASPTEDLWSSILDSVSKSRSIPSKQILLLGESQTGKSTIATALLQKKLERDQVQDDFALGYSWADVRDEADEGMKSPVPRWGFLITHFVPESVDTLARLSVYTVQSSNPTHLGLVSQVLPAKTSLHNTLVMILLDWTKPWTFVEQLENWLIWVDRWAKGDGSREMEVARDEERERCEYMSPHRVVNY
jgi:dynein light intermediate chain 1, cytosolic